MEHRTNQDDWLLWQQSIHKILSLSAEIFEVWTNKYTNMRVDLDLTEYWQHALAMLSRALTNPESWLDAQMAWTHDYLSLWQAQSRFFLEGQRQAVIEPEQHDKRFSAAQWQQHPAFDFLKQCYLLYNKHCLSWVVSHPDLSRREKATLRFQMTQLLNAISPTNFLLTNPEAMQLTCETCGQNLVNGLENMLADVKATGDVFAIRMTDLDAFRVGKHLAVTPGAVIAENALMQLIQYQPQTETVYLNPVLIIPPWINKYYILDLAPGKSLIEHLVQLGHTVFVLSWRNPDKRHADIDFEDYLALGGLAALEQVRSQCGDVKVNVMGFCIGGTLLACLCAYLKKQHADWINTITFLATLLDFSEPGDLGIFIDDTQIAYIETQMAAKGYLEGSQLAALFNVLRDNDLIWSYYTHNYLQGKSPAAFDMLYWNCDSTNLPAAMHSYYLRQMYLNNALIQPNACTLHGVSINLHDIDAPVYCLATEQDHIAPWASVFAGSQHFSSTVTFVLGGSGHIAGIINPPHKNKYYYRTAQPVSQASLSASAWYDNAQCHQGSWWTHWTQWLSTHSQAQIPSRAIKPEQVIESAPGCYVMKPCRPLPATQADLDQTIQQDECHYAVE